MNTITNNNMPQVNSITFQQYVDDYQHKSTTSLLFPLEYREITISDLRPCSYKKFRKKYSLSGRIKILMKVEPRVWKKNEELEYKYERAIQLPELTLLTQSGEWNTLDAGCMVETKHPIGDLYVVQPRPVIQNEVGDEPTEVKPESYEVSSESEEEVEIELPSAVKSVKEYIELLKKDNDKLKEDNDKLKKQYSDTIDDMSEYMKEANETESLLKEQNDYLMKDNKERKEEKKQLANSCLDLHNKNMDLQVKIKELKEVNDKLKAEMEYPLE